MYNFGGGSKSNTSSETDNIDQRLLQESGAIGATSSGGGSSSVSVSSNSTTNVNTLDGGAIKAAFGLGEHAVDSVTDFATSSLSGAHHTAELALKGALASVGDSQAAFRDATAQVASAYSGATNKVATAYEDAKIGNRSTMMMGAMAIGAVALVIVGTRGGR